MSARSILIALWDTTLVLYVITLGLLYWTLKGVFFLIQGAA